MNTFRNIRPGDVVTYSTPQGQTGRARAQMFLCFPAHVVCNAGGRYGRPVVVNATNYVSHRAGKSPADALDFVPRRQISRD